MEPMQQKEWQHFPALASLSVQKQYTRWPNASSRQAASSKPRCEKANTGAYQRRSCAREQASVCVCVCVCVCNFKFVMEKADESSSH